MDYNLTNLYKKMHEPKSVAKTDLVTEAITEAMGLGSYNYQVPSDTEEKLFDFYYLTLIGKPESLESTINKRAWGSWVKTDVSEGQMGGFFNEEQVNELIEATREAQNKISTELQNDLLDATYFSIAAEIRHLLDYNKLEDVMAFAEQIGYGDAFAKYYTSYKKLTGVGDAKKMIKSLVDKNDPMSKLAVRADVYLPGETERQQQKQAQTFFKNNSKRIASYTAAKNAFPDDNDFVDFSEKGFFGTAPNYTGPKLAWASSFGGPAWGKIAQGWKMLYNATTDLDKMVYVDHILDLEHNTGAMLNKVQRWAQNGSWSWIRNALDFKRDAEHPLKDFLDKISPSLMYLNKKLRYAITGMAEDNPNWKDFDKIVDGTKISTNSGASADVTSFGQAGDDVTTTTGIPGTIYKIGSSGKTYVDMSPTNQGFAAKDYANLYFLKFSKSGKLEGLLGKQSGQKAPLSPGLDTMFGDLQKPKDTGDANQSTDIDGKVISNNGVEGTIVKKSASGYTAISFDNAKKFKSNAKYLLINPDGHTIGWSAHLPAGPLKTGITGTIKGWKLLTPKGKYGTIKSLAKKGTPVTSLSQKDIQTVAAAPSYGPSGIPKAVQPTPADNTVLKNQGLYTNLLGKFHPKVIKHTGPAGQAGVKSLIIKLDSYGQTYMGREAYTGHLKVKTSHAGSNILYYNKAKAGPGKKTSIGLGKIAKPWQDKALVLGLQFSIVKRNVVIKKGTLVQAILGPGIIIDGPVNLKYCILDGCGFTERGLTNAGMIECKINSSVIIDPNKFANTSAYAFWGNITTTIPGAPAGAPPIQALISTGDAPKTGAVASLMSSDALSIYSANL